MYPRKLAIVPILCVAMLVTGLSAYGGTGHVVTISVAPYTLKTVRHYNAPTTDQSVYGFGASLGYRWDFTRLLHVGADVGYRGFVERDMLPDRYSNQLPLLATFGFHHKGKSKFSWHAGLGAGVEFGWFGGFSGTYFEAQAQAGISYTLTERLSLATTSAVSIILQPNKNDQLLDSRSLAVSPLLVGISYSFGKEGTR